MSTENPAELLERKILKIIENSGEKGMIQREIWKLINLDSRKGIKIIKRLEQQGYLVREPIQHKGRKTYILRPGPRIFRKIILPSWLDNIPCFYCPELYRCSSEQAITSCLKIEKFLEKEEKYELEVIKNV